MTTYRKINRILFISISLTLFSAASVTSADRIKPAKSTKEILRRWSTNTGTAWTAVDGLGRVLPGPKTAGPPRAERFVGIFYFLWSGQHGSASRKPSNISKILEKYPNALETSASPPWGPKGQVHYWGEPLFGYYSSDDPWVIRRHAYLLADAGIDTLIFDTTNRVTYRNVYMTLLKVFTRVRAEGGRTPQVAFMVNTRAGETARELFRDLYKPGLYKKLWFRWKGKPLLICDPAEADPDIRSFFTLRKAHWPFEQVNTAYAWHWEAAYPQVYGYTDDPKNPEEVNVSVAQNLRRSDGKVTNMSDGNARGRSFHNGKMDKHPGAVNYGYNFQEQWERALQLDPPFVMVTGWNEWIAGRYSRPGKPVVFVDQYNQEYSRDIEMAKGAHHDNYYYQLITNVRRYKGMPALPGSSSPKTIKLDYGFLQWRDVAPAYKDHIGETLPRDFRGAGAVHYTNRTGRNDFTLMKVARDKQFIYFYARTADPITPWNNPSRSDKSSGSNDSNKSNKFRKTRAAKAASWMMLLIDSDMNPRTGWEGYDFIVNRSVIDNKNTWLEQNTGGWNWKKFAKVRYVTQGKEMHIALPRNSTFFPAGEKKVSLGFKWADNIQKPGDIMDFYVSGDCAPEGRFKYLYTAR